QNVLRKRRIMRGVLERDRTRTNGAVPGAVLGRRNRLICSEVRSLPGATLTADGFAAAGSPHGGNGRFPPCAPFPLVTRAARGMTSTGKARRSRREACYVASKQPSKCRTGLRTLRPRALRIVGGPTTLGGPSAL